MTHIRLLPVFRFAALGVLLFVTACPRNPDQGPLVDDPMGGDVVGEDEFLLGPGVEVELEGRDSIGGMMEVDSSAYAPVYFAFDSSTVAPSELSKAREVADALNSSPAYVVVLKGHTDERGSREYNLALGERRALAVREVLMSYGVPASDIQTLSMGEEQPAVQGFDESAYSLNRRVEFQLMR